MREFEYVIDNFEYVIDNNALSALTLDQRACAFFRAKCHIPSEVLNEARGFPDIKALKENVYPTTGSVLEMLIKVMASVPATDTRLVDLYANLGNADPLIVACALDGRQTSNDMLFGPAWVVVSNDQAVQAKAKEFCIEVKTNEEFAAILDDQSSPKSRALPVQPAGSVTASG